MVEDREMPVEAAYDAWAQSYDAGVNLTRDAASAKIQAWIPLLRGRNLLELGCGTGKNTAALAALARRVDAVDFSSRMLAHAARRPECASVRFMRHDIASGLPLDSEHYDVVLESLVLEHIEQLTPVFSEAFRVLRSGGDFLGAELHPYRQRLGKQARFRAADGQSEILVTAYRHSISGFVNAAVAEGFDVVRLDEDEDPTGELRLFSFHFRKP
jgi:ubiquinone/menaquinone biosynthesis C-methylase UbiE